MAKEEPVKFRKSSASASGSRNFSKDYSTLRDTAIFHNSAPISIETSRTFVKIVS